MYVMLAWVSGCDVDQRWVTPVVRQRQFISRCHNNQSTLAYYIAKAYLKFDWVTRACLLASDKNKMEDLT